MQTLRARIKTQIIDKASGIVIKETPWANNLMTDRCIFGITAVAGGYPYSSLANVGNKIFLVDSTNATYAGTQVASGGVTFRNTSFQTFTASANTFLKNVGRYNMTGARILLSAPGSIDKVFTMQNITSTTFEVPEIVDAYYLSNNVTGTVYYTNDININAFDTTLTSVNYLTSGANCGSVFVGNVVTHQRVFTYAPTGYRSIQAIGYNCGSGTNMVGVVQLPAPDVISDLNIYVVTMQLWVTYGPSSPIAVVNTGTGINTTGTAMLEAIDCAIVKSDGTEGWSPATLGGSTAYCADPCTNNIIQTVYPPYGALICAPYSQRTTPSTTTQLTTTNTFNCPLSAYYGQANNHPVTGENDGLDNTRFTCQTTGGYTFTVAGQTCFGIALCTRQYAVASSKTLFDIALTNQFTLTAGLYHPTFTFQNVYYRPLA